VLYNCGIDIVVGAHEHSLEITYPVKDNGTVTAYNWTNPDGIVHIVQGFAGCNEDDGECVNAILTPGGNWSAFRSSTEGQYSYSRFLLPNTTHIHVESVLVEAGAETEFPLWITKYHHGPRGQCGAR
jgi:Iron/zinc purple acid phosphatase-like protein C